MKFTIKVVEDVCVLKLEGRFMGGGDSFFLREKIKDVMNMGIQKVLIDLDGVPYIDSTGVGFLVGSHTTISQEGGQMKLVRVKPKIQEVLKVMNLLKVFEIFEEDEAAMKSFVDKKSTSTPAAPRRKRATKASKEAD